MNYKNEIENILYKKITFACRIEPPKKGMVLRTRSEGPKVKALSPAYYQNFKQDKKEILIFIHDVMELIQKNFDLTIHVDHSGKLIFEDIRCIDTT